LRQTRAKEDALKTGWTGLAAADTGANPIDGILLDLISTAQRTYPAVSLPLEVFVAYLADRAPAGVPMPLALRQMHTTDLYLACACARGDVRALAAFDDRCVRPLDRALFKMGVDSDLIADVKQELRHRLLVGDGQQPKIIDFGGRGDLRGWVRVMAVRHALLRLSRTRRERSLDGDELLEDLVGTSCPELDHVKRRYRKEFKRAFEGALRELPDRELTVLRQHYIDGLTLDELCALYRVHRSTAARMLVRARVLVLEGTRARMMSQLRVQPHDLDSIMRMIQSQLEVSLRGALRRRRRKR
jgi:RNA polymerase sigma-70 factor (ECF subfamily)